MVSIGALSEEYERTNEEWKSIVELCQMEDAASTAQLRALANKHGVENVSTLNKRGLCHMFAMLWEKDHSQTDIQLPVTPSAFQDPVSFMPLEDPYVTNNGYTYSRSTLNQIQCRYKCVLTSG